jgi:hypothetical protein
MQSSQKQLQYRATGTSTKNTTDLKNQAKCCNIEKQLTDQGSSASEQPF